MIQVKVRSVVMSLNNFIYQLMPKKSTIHRSFYLWITFRIHVDIVMHLISRNVDTSANWRHTTRNYSHHLFIVTWKNTKVNSVVEFVDVEFKTPKIFSQYYNNIRQRKTANSHICEAQNDLKVQCLLHYHHVKVRIIVLPLSYRRRLQHSNH